MKLALLLFSISANAWSMGCDGIPEGQVVRLDQDGKSLSKAAIQDQDGVGSCFANQASLLLQSAIPGNPNLSYLNLGLYYANDKSLKDKRDKGGSKLFTRDGKDVSGNILPKTNSQIHGGLACAAINMALDRQKESGNGSICKAEDVNLEHSFFNAKTGNNVDALNLQEKAIAGASRYMNTFQERFGYSFEKNTSKEILQKQREDADKFSAALTAFVQNNSDQYLEKKCLKPNIEKTLQSIDNTMTRALLASNNCYDDKFKQKTIGANCKTFKNLGFTYIINHGDNTRTLKYELSSSTKDNLERSLPSLYKSEGGMDGFLSNLSHVIMNNDKSKPKTADDIVKFNTNFLNNISTQDKQVLEEEYNRIALHQIDDCKKDNVVEYFKDKEDFINKAKRDKVLCRYSELLDSASDMATTLPPKTFKNISTILDFLTSNAGLNYDKALMDLIANDCPVEKRIKIPKDLKCSLNVISFGPEDFSKEGMSSNAQSVIKENRSKMIASIAANHAIGLDICSRFWSYPAYDYNAEDKSTKMATCQSTGKDGYHSITMIGYRCKDNRIQYLSQNSWGPNWSLKNNPYEIENGKIWIDEDKVYKNLSQINYLSQ
jgi:hypothetical protein